MPSPERARATEARSRPRRAEARPTPRERLPFASAYPESEELDALLAAFDAGDHARVRSGAPELAARTENARVADAARDLHRRIHADATATYLLVLPLALLAYLFVHHLLEAM